MMIKAAIVFVHCISLKMFLISGFEVLEMFTPFDLSGSAFALSNFCSKLRKRMCCFLIKKKNVSFSTLC